MKTGWENNIGYGVIRPVNMSITLGKKYTANTPHKGKG